MRRRATKEEVNKKSTKPNGLLTYNDIPEWMKDNNFITHGYRPVSHSVKQSLRSIFNSIHNESLNIHSHLWGAIFFLLALVAISTDTFHRKHPNYGWKDYLGFTIFILSAITCLSFSFLYHTFSNHSKEFANTWHALDYAGICILIAGSVRILLPLYPDLHHLQFVPCLYYGFYCSPAFQIFYIASMLIASSVALYIVLHPHYRRPAFRKARTTVFIALGLSGILPITHAIANDGLGVMRTMALDYVVLSGMMYILGATIYACRFPEAYLSHKFNFSYVGASHQIFHFFVVAAAVCHYLAIRSSQSFYGDPEFDYCHAYR
ncbi:HlyIII-domain-containing protein [Wallemia mellicola]|uniref:HlyIII-domain-containing protein n=1 Tax=Wallemia mellicola TaxID=1708541 RepID=A0AB38MT10_9BASI|nr:HlyIII-domain-containing protein [Wallemia mellicola]TIC02499.1 HlyIII-domain-containing protein [Wallemia mellicola]TIC62832.1 HlyIII-domain-containing protein [Wallemia mellicola]